MRIIFTSIDGVIKKKEANEIDRSAAHFLGRIALEARAKLVILPTHSDTHTREAMALLLERHRFFILHHKEDWAIKSTGQMVGELIRLWLKDRAEIEKWIILDPSPSDQFHFDQLKSVINLEQKRLLTLQNFTRGYSALCH